MGRPLKKRSSITGRPMAKRAISQLELALIPLIPLIIQMTTILLPLTVNNNVIMNWEEIISPPNFLL
jgi:hypothetical protein